MGSGLPATAAPGAAPGASNNNRLEGLLDQLVRRYRQLRNYADHGFVRDRRRHGKQVHFETFCRHPARGQVTVFVGNKDLLIRGLVYRRLQKIQVRQGVRAHGLRREVAAALVSASGPPAGC